MIGKARRLSVSSLFCVGEGIKGGEVLSLPLCLLLSFGDLPETIGKRKM